MWTSLRKLTVVTGLSGSGKSSLAFDTLYAEGQRRYVESLSAYVRQFAGRLEKPDVDRIDNLTPAIAVEQRVASRSSRSTVGTVTEVHDHLKLLWARLGRTYSPVSGGEVKKGHRHRCGRCGRFPTAKDAGSWCVPQSTYRRTAPCCATRGLAATGLCQTALDGEPTTIEDQLTSIRAQEEAGTGTVEVALHLVIDRLAVPEEDGREESMHRLADSVDTAFYEGHGVCELHWVESKGTRIESFSDRYELRRDGLRRPFSRPLQLQQSPRGLPPMWVRPCHRHQRGPGHPRPCPRASTTMVAPWRGEKASRYKQRCAPERLRRGLPVHTPYADLTDRQKRQLWEGTRSWKGIHHFSALEAKSYKIQNRVMLSRYRGRTACDHVGEAALRIGILPCPHRWLGPGRYPPVCPWKTCCTLLDGLLALGNRTGNRVAPPV